MTSSIHVSPTAFKKGYRAFQKNEPRDAMYKTATFLVQHFWGNPADMADSLGVLLLTWNQAFYRYGSFRFSRLERAINRNMSALEALRGRDIATFAKVDEPEVKRLFAVFLRALRIAHGKKKDTKSPVAVAKALHLLAPSFLPTWDDKIATGYGCYYSPPAATKYVTFMYEMKRLAESLSCSLPPDCGKTFLKLIDEYNYARFTKGWV